MKSRSFIYSSIFVLLTFCPYFAIGQIEVYRSYEHYQDASNKETYKGITLSSFSNNFILRDFQGNKYKIHCDSIWGYTNERNILYKVRDHRGKSLKAEIINNRIVLYSDLRDDTLIFDNMIIPGKKLFVYFSTSLQDNIFPLSTKELLEKFNLNDDEKRKLERLRNKERLKKKNSKTGEFHIIEEIFN